LLIIKQRRPKTRNAKEGAENQEKQSRRGGGGKVTGERSHAKLRLKQTRIPVAGSKREEGIQSAESKKNGWGGTRKKPNAKCQKGDRLQESRNLREGVEEKSEHNEEEREKRTKREGRGNEKITGENQSRF